MGRTCSRRALSSNRSASASSWSRCKRTPADLDIENTLRLVEDYKPLDIESATMAVALCRGIRDRYPDWRYLIDGDGGDENLKDYPIEENPELTIRSVINNPMLYQEGWGVGKIKHSLTYSGGLSRSYTRTYAPARHLDSRDSALHAARGDRRRRSHSVHRTDQLRRAAALRTQGEIVSPRHCSNHRPPDARFPEAAVPTRRACLRRCAEAQVCRCRKPNTASSFCRFIP